MPARNARCCPVLVLALAVLFAPGGRAAQNTESSTLADRGPPAVLIATARRRASRSKRRRTTGGLAGGRHCGFEGTGPRQRQKA